MQLLKLLKHIKNYNTKNKKTLHNEKIESTFFYTRILFNKNLSIDTFNETGGGKTIVNR